MSHFSEELLRIFDAKLNQLQLDNSGNMNNNIQPDDLIYQVVVNHEEQYSIWLGDRALPLGWKDTGKRGTKSECLAYIKEVWTDMRPLSLRQKMQATASSV